MREANRLATGLLINYGYSVETIEGKTEKRAESKSRAISVLNLGI